MQRFIFNFLSFESIDSEFDNKCKGFLKYGNFFSRGTLYLNNLWPKNNILNFKIDMMVNLLTTQTSSTQPVHYSFLQILNTVTFKCKCIWFLITTHN